MPWMIFQPLYLCCNIEGLITVKPYITTHDEKAKYFKNTVFPAGCNRRLFCLFGPGGQAGDDRQRL